MPYITFSKSYSASDDGSKLAGADIGQLQADIAQILNGGITDVNVSGTAAIAEAKLAFAATGGHSHNGTNSTLVSGGNLLRADITGCLPKYVSVDTVNAESGAIELNNIVYTRNVISSTINLSTDAHWVGGTNHRAISSTFYIYAYNDSGTTWNIKFSSTAPAFANCGTDTEGTKVFYASAGVWYRCIGTAVTNATGSGELSSASVAVYPVATIPASVEVFTSNGTWTKPSGATIVEVVCVGGGGGGATGATAVDANNPGGSGGGGGARTIRVFRASDLTATVAVTIGNGGAANTAGQNTTFGAYLSGGGGGAGIQSQGASCTTGVPGGGGGGPFTVGALAVHSTSVLGGGGAVAGQGGMGGAGGGGKLADVGGCAEYGGAGGGGGVKAAAGKAGGSSMFGGAGGGGGGGSVTTNGAAGGANGSFTEGGGGAAGVAGVGGVGDGGDGVISCGDGGGGGAGKDGTAYAGGNGGAWGGGGGGGGSTHDNSAGGTGGTGGKGGCIVYSW